MNGKLCKRMRTGALIEAADTRCPWEFCYKQQKREYRARPYHKRPCGLWPRVGHSKRLQQHHVRQETRLRPVELAAIAKSLYRLHRTIL